MDKRVDLTARNFPTAVEDAARATSRYDGPESAYHLAFTDVPFLLRDELRPVRMQLELLKPELVQREQGIESTIVIFGSARIKTPEDAQALLAQARAGGDAAAIRRAEIEVDMSRYYTVARQFAHIVTTANTATVPAGAKLRATSIQSTSITRPMAAASMPLTAKASMMKAGSITNSPWAKLMVPLACHSRVKPSAASA